MTIRQQKSTKMYRSTALVTRQKTIQPKQIKESMRTTFR